MLYTSGMISRERKQGEVTITYIVCKSWLQSVAADLKEALDLWEKGKPDLAQTVASLAVQRLQDDNAFHRSPEHSIKNTASIEWKHDVDAVPKTRAENLLRAINEAFR